MVYFDLFLLFELPDLVYERWSLRIVYLIAFDFDFGDAPTGEGSTAVVPET